MGELREALEQGRVMEMFGCGTACSISPIGSIYHRQNGEATNLLIPTAQSEWQLHARIMETLTNIQVSQRGLSAASDRLNVKAAIDAEKATHHTRNNSPLKFLCSTV